MALQNMKDYIIHIYNKLTGNHIPEDGILHSNRRENLKPYMKDLICWVSLPV
jgi:hypothetical protein